MGIFGTVFKRGKTSTKFSPILDVLDRVENIPSLDSLIQSISKKSNKISVDKAAIGFDTNVLLRLAKHPKSPDIVDYLSSTHKPPVLLPGQVIQEFWNNQLNAVDTISESMKKNFEKFKKDVEKVGGDSGNYADQFESLIENFSQEHGNVYDHKTIRNLTSILETLKEKAKVPYAPRELFHPRAILRKKTKTPPGFKDDQNNFGDAYVWFDFLTGLLEAKEEKKKFAKAVFVTAEKKVDWCRAGIAHPILVAEIQAIFGIQFETWTLDQLAAQISYLVDPSQDK